MKSEGSAKRVLCEGIQRNREIEHMQVSSYKVWKAFPLGFALHYLFICERICLGKIVSLKDV